jgi:hypothetical protein
VDGAAVLYLERAGKGLLTLPAADDLELRDAALGALVGLIGPDRPFRELRLERVDREPVAKSVLAEPLQALGFRPSYRGYLYRPGSVSTASSDRARAPRPTR